MNKERQYGGFSVYVSSTLVLFFIVVWAFLPKIILQGQAIAEVYEILPQRYWLIAIQCLVLMTMLFTYVGMLSYNIDILTVPLDDMRTITDTQARIVEYKNFSELDWYITNETSGVADLPINEVNRVLYLQE
ncbi:Gpi19 [Kluyveromyces lactis]|nr:Gpi19 [Kluyveromyces lactis]